jgi:hypothetical protein
MPNDPTQLRVQPEIIVDTRDIASLNSPAKAEPIFISWKR